jgi:hypothetical protein
MNEEGPKPPDLDPIPTESNDANPSRFKHFRHFTLHPTYKKFAPWLSFLRRFGPALTAASLLISAFSLIVTGIGVKQSRDIYLRSLQPVLFLQIGPPDKDHGRAILVSNPSGADAHDVRFACLKLPAWTSMYATIPLVEQAGAQEIARNTVSLPFPIDLNCRRFDAGPEPLGMKERDTVLLPLFICYRDESAKHHSIVRLYQYKPNEQNYETLPLDSYIGKEILEEARQQCGATPQAS